MAIIRVVESELLDHLPAGDPEAIRSRKDLRLINCLMGNQIWFFRQIRHHFQQISGGVLELGAGDGYLSRSVHRHFPSISLSGIDLQPRPATLPDEIHWLQGNLFDLLPRISTSVLIGGMIIHHFNDEELSMLAPHLQNFRAIFLCEPFRSSLSLTWARLMWPFVGRVTRHDMPASIRAGFRLGELTGIFHLGEEWDIRESIDWRGSLRFAAVRR